MTDPTPLGGGGTRRVTVVDDDRVALAMVTNALRRRGYDVRSYSDPREALVCLAGDRPQAVITDMHMPHVSGLDVVAEVRRRLGDDAPPVIVLSSQDDESVLEQAFRQGAIDYILKPVNEKELAVKVEKAIKRLGQVLTVGPPAKIPNQVADYDLIEPIGQGGTAAVFKARRPGETTDYALKVVWPHLTTSAEALLRFRREIDILGQLDHPGLVRFVSAGRHEGCFYYVMEYVAGGTLRDRIERHGPGSVTDALDLLAALAPPLAYLHDRGFVHRDLKPGNLFYAIDGRVVLGDFGLAKNKDDRGITIAEEFIGTPLYLAPEVFVSDRFDHRVDLYAAGMCAIELLLGHPPLEETDSVRLIARITSSDVPTVQELLPDAPPSLHRLLMKLTARRPDERTASARDLAADVAALEAELGGAR